MQQARLFLALDLDEHVLDGLCAASARLKQTIPDANWCRRDALHMTLRFFGEMPLASVAEIDRIARAAAARQQPFELEARGVGAFPSLDRPRVIWAGAGAGSETVSAFATALLGQFELAGLGREERGFVPHVTLARVKRMPHGGFDAWRAMAAGMEDRSFGTTPVDRIVLYSSELTPRGPVYAAVNTWMLGEQ